MFSSCHCFPRPSRPPPRVARSAAESVSSSLWPPRALSPLLRDQAGGVAATGRPPWYLPRDSQRFLRRQLFSIPAISTLWLCGLSFHLQVWSYSELRHNEAFSLSLSGPLLEACQPQAPPVSVPRRRHWGPRRPRPLSPRGQIKAIPIRPLVGKIG